MTALPDLLTPQIESVILCSMWTRTISGLLMVTAALAFPGMLVGQTEDPLFGTWELDTSASIQSSTRFKRTTCWIEPWEDGLKVSYDVVGTRGGVIHLEWTGKFDGQDYPVQGADYVLTNAYTRIDARTYAVVIKVDGGQVATARTAVSSDGQTLTTVTTERNAEGQEIQSTVVYEKQ
jgi:hypothetical protein